MAGSLEIGSAWQSPRSSFTFDLSQTGTTNDDWQSPRISFSINLQQTGRISPEKRKREEVAGVNCDTDFEFCVKSNNNSGRNSIIGETLLPVADQLFVDDKTLPLIHGPVEAQPITIARHISLERSRCQSAVRPTSAPPSKITSSCSGKVSSKSSSHKPLNKWKEIMLKLSNQERKSSKVIEQDISGNTVKQQHSSTRSRWSFSRSCSTGGETKGNGLFCSLPFARSHSTAERKYKPVTSGCTSKETETDVQGLVAGSKPLEAWGISNKVQSAPRCLQLKPRFEAEDGKAETKAKHTPVRSKLVSQQATGSVDGKGRLMVRNLESSSTSATTAASLDSPRPGRLMAEGSFLLKANNSMGGRGAVRVSPVLNVPTCIGIGGGGLFGFSPVREKKHASAYHHHYSRTPTCNRKKGN